MHYRGRYCIEEALAEADQVYITRVHTSIKNGEVFFPVLDSAIWEKVWEEFHPQDEQHAFAFTFQRFERKKA